MSPLVLQLPCGNRQSIASSVTFGRGNPSSLTDGIMSRQQVQLVPVEGLGQVLQLTNLGLNRKVAAGSMMLLDVPSNLQHSYSSNICSQLLMGIKLFLPDVLAWQKLLTV